MYRGRKETGRREEIIEPELPIVDPHHHLVDRPETGRYLLPELLTDTGSSQRSDPRTEIRGSPGAVSASSAGARGGHNATASVNLEWLSMYRAAGPVELRPVGEIEFANSVAPMVASSRPSGGSPYATGVVEGNPGSGTYGRARVCAGIVGYVDLARGAPAERVPEAMIAVGGRGSAPASSITPIWREAPRS